MVALQTDLYQLTMAQGYWKLGRGTDEAVFHLTFREHPFGGGYTVSCGLAYVVDESHDFAGEVLAAGTAEAGVVAGAGVDRGVGLHGDRIHHVVPDELGEGQGAR